MIISFKKGGRLVRSLLTWFVPLLIFVIVFPAAAASFEMPEEAQLSAERMRFDSDSGNFLATGNVIIQSNGLTVRSPRGEGNVRNREVHFEEGISALGSWQGDLIDLTAGSISLFFAQTPTYIADNGVMGSVGRLSLDVEKLYMKGAEISALDVRLLRDRETDVTFAAESINGTILNGVLNTLVADNRVRLRGRPNVAGEMVDIRADRAVYSIERGSVVLSGNVRAVQQGRTLTAQSLVYFPASNRIDAIGGLEMEGGNLEPRPARIMIDLSQERRN